MRKNNHMSKIVEYGRRQVVVCSSWLGSVVRFILAWIVPTSSRKRWCSRHPTTTHEVAIGPFLFRLFLDKVKESATEDLLRKYALKRIYVLLQIERGIKMRMAYRHYLGPQTDLSTHQSTDQTQTYSLCKKPSIQFRRTVLIDPDLAYNAMKEMLSGLGLSRIDVEDAAINFRHYRSAVAGFERSYCGFSLPNVV